MKKNTPTKKRTPSTRTRTSRSKKKKTPSALDKMTEVRTGYARLALMLVLVNLFLTGYVVSRISTLEGEAQADGARNEQPTATSSESTGGGI